MTEHIVSQCGRPYSMPHSFAAWMAVLDEDGVHALVFPCKRAVDGWKHAITGHFVDVEPTHWRYWGDEERKPSA